MRSVIFNLDANSQALVTSASHNREILRTLLFVFFGVVRSKKKKSFVRKELLLFIPDRSHISDEERLKSR